MGQAAAAEGSQDMRGRRAEAFLALTPVALRAPSVSAKNAKSVYHVLDTKCIPCATLDRLSSRLFFAGRDDSRPPKSMKTSSGPLMLCIRARLQPCRKKPITIRALAPACPAP
jgi:hypothetical protein